MVQPSIAAYVNLRWRAGYQAVSNTPTRLAGLLDAELSQYDQTLPERIQLVVADVPQLGVLASLMGRVWLEAEQRHGLFQHSLIFSGAPTTDEGVRSAFHVLYGPKPEQTIDALYNMASTLEYAQGRPAFARLLVSAHDLAVADAIVPIVQHVLDELARDWPHLHAYMPAPEPAALQRTRASAPALASPAGTLRAPVEALLAASTPRVVMRAEGGIELEPPPVRPPKRRPTRMRVEPQAPEPTPVRAERKPVAAEVESPTLPDLPKVQEPVSDTTIQEELHPSRIVVEGLDPTPLTTLRINADDDRTEEYDPNRGLLGLVSAPPQPAPPPRPAVPDADTLVLPEPEPLELPAPPTSRALRALLAVGVGVAFAAAVILGIELGTRARASRPMEPIPPVQPALELGTTEPTPAPPSAAPTPEPDLAAAPSPTARAKPRPTVIDLSVRNERGFTFAMSTRSACEAIFVSWTDDVTGERVNQMGPLGLSPSGRAECTLAANGTDCPVPAGARVRSAASQPTNLEWLCCERRRDTSWDCLPMASRRQ